MEKIAIYGHSTRSKDVIKTLESLGGKNRSGNEGWNESNGYYVDEDNHICCKAPRNIPKDYKLYTLEEYEQIQKNMEKRTIQIDLTTAREWYQQGGELKKVALQAFNENELKSLPSSWEEYCKINPYLDKNKDVFILANGQITPLSYETCKKGNPGAIPSKERAEQFLILNKLLQIRDYYNQGWKPDWDDCTDKYVIWSFENELHLDVSTYASSLFAFKSKEVRDTFFENFENDLEKVKEFL